VKRVVLILVIARVRSRDVKRVVPILVVARVRSRDVKRVRDLLGSRALKVRVEELREYKVIRVIRETKEIVDSKAQDSRGL